jgi:hypothetical protein
MGERMVNNIGKRKNQDLGYEATVETGAPYTDSATLNIEHGGRRFL